MNAVARPGEPPECVRCGQTFLAFPPRVGPLCPPCLYHVATRWTDELDRQRLWQLDAELVHIADQATLVRRLGTALVDIVDVERCEIFVRDEQMGDLRLAYPTPAAPEVLAAELVQCLEVLPAPVLASDAAALSASAAALFRARRIGVAIPLRVHDHLIGVVALGEKKNGDRFYGADLHFLATLALSGAVALENTMLARRLRRAELALEQTTRLASLGVLAAGTAHEIRNLLVPVKTFLDLLLERPEEPDFTSLRELCLDQLGRVTELIDDLLALGRSSAAPCAPVLLGPILEPVARLMDLAARQRGVEVVLGCPPELPAVWVHAGHMRQIALNLLLNAIETSPQGGRVTLELRAGDAERMRPGVVLEVRDEGPGIPPEQIAHIFDPFFTTKEGGTGLGLAVVQRMVLESGGEITVESAPGQGSTFRVTLPAARSELPYPLLQFGSSPAATVDPDYRSAAHPPAAPSPQRGDGPAPPGAALPGSVKDGRSQQRLAGSPPALRPFSCNRAERLGSARSLDETARSPAVPNPRGILPQAAVPRAT